MPKLVSKILTSLCLLVFLTANSFAAGKLTGGINYAIPDWFKESFLTLADDVEEAGEENKTLMLFFHMDGCPYCARMIAESYPKNREYIEKNFDTVAINIKGAREVTTIDDETLTEKQLSKKVRVLFTPTVVFMDTKGKAVFRVNGYWPPQNFRYALEYVKDKAYEKQSIQEYVKARNKAGSYKFISNTQFADVQDLSAVKKPLAIIFEDKNCEICTEVHEKLFSAGNIKKQFERYTVVRLDRDGINSIKGPAGKDTTPKDLAARMKINFSPSIVLMDDGKERHRIAGRLYNNHFETSLMYVADKKYKDYADWIAYQNARQDEMMAKGQDVHLGPPAN